MNPIPPSSFSSLDHDGVVQAFFRIPHASFDSEEAGKLANYQEDDGEAFSLYRSVIAKRALIAGYGDEVAFDPETSLLDLISDALHLAVHLGIAPDVLLGVSQKRYEQEATNEGRTILVLIGRQKQGDTWREFERTEVDPQVDGSEDTAIKFLNSVRERHAEYSEMEIVPVERAKTLCDSARS